MTLERPLSSSPRRPKWILERLAERSNSECTGFARAFSASAFQKPLKNSRSCFLMRNHVEENKSNMPIFTDPKNTKLVVGELRAFVSKSRDRTLDPIPMNLEGLSPKQFEAFARFANHVQEESLGNLSERMNAIEATERDRLFRAESARITNPSVRQWASRAPLSVLRGLLQSLPAAERSTQKNSLSEAMGLSTASPEVARRATDGRFILPTITPSRVREIKGGIAANQKGK